LRFLNIELFLKATLPAILAGVVWVLPLCAIASPASLTSISGLKNSTATCKNVPSFNFELENGYNVNSYNDPGTGLSFYQLNPNDNFTFYYGSPSANLQKVAQLALLSTSGFLQLPNPCEGGSNCSYTFSFDGPSYSCQEQPEFANSTGATKSQLVPTGESIYIGASSGSEAFNGEPSYWIDMTPENETDIGIFLEEPSLWLGYVINTTVFLESDENTNWEYQMEQHVVECTLYNTTYDYAISFTDGIMAIESRNTTLIAPALAPGAKIGPLDPNYEAFS
jgi:hypothetical protein